MTFEIAVFHPFARTELLCGYPAGRTLQLPPQNLRILSMPHQVLLCGQACNQMAAQTSGTMSDP
eukprot:CAMPEP_0172782304 /NCGR_PEP_ID=MMETSP1074-20121228/203866_1 /TAXON_ID=2916 /ORGANISM="Ceratium fusus, Strain PA161109" /LENGTH=63 /DNA_ID=CAMNT_0013619287 /DNA_START=1020 /DNA_END=1211 /DNA_ORIENTATION=-